MNNVFKKVMLVAVVLSALLCAGCNNEHLNVQISDADSEVGKHKGTIIYSGYSYQVHRVEINGVPYLINTKGGIIKE